MLNRVWLVTFRGRCERRVEVSVIANDCIRAASVAVDTVNDDAKARWDSYATEKEKAEGKCPMREIRDISGIDEKPGVYS